MRRGPGVEGLVHVSEMSWVKRNVHPGKIVSTSQEIEVMVLEVDQEKRRISLGLKQCIDNPWTAFSEKFPVGSTIEGEIKNTTEFGLFVGLDSDVDGMVHMSDLDWSRASEEALAEYKKGDVVKAVVLEVDPVKERISLGIKQLSDDPFAAVASKRKGDTVTCTVSQVNDQGVEVTIGESGSKTFIRRSDLSRDRNEQRPERFSVGDKLDAMVTGIEKSSRRLNLSIKALDISEEKAAVKQYGSSDSGASLGDILGAVLKKATGEKAKDAAEEATEEKPKKAKAKDADEKAGEEKPKKAKAKGAAKKSTKKSDKAKKADAGDEAKEEVKADVAKEEAPDEAPDQ